MAIIRKPADFGSRPVRVGAQGSTPAPAPSAQPSGFTETARQAAQRQPLIVTGQKTRNRN